MPETTSSVKVNLKKHSLDAVRYAAYAVSGGAYIFMRSAGKGGIEVEFTPKARSQAAGRKPRTGNKAGAAKDFVSRFKQELKDEKLRSEIFDANRDLREFMILKALAYEELPPSALPEDSGLTPEQEKELDALIAQVEAEIKKESAAGGGKDPLGVTSTWEEKYGANTGRKKK